MKVSASASNVVASAFANSARMSLSALASTSSRGIANGALRPRLVSPHAEGGVVSPDSLGDKVSWASTCNAMAMTSSGSSFSALAHTAKGCSWPPTTQSRRGL